MEIIKNLSDMIEEEIKDATKYAKCALENKDNDPALAEAFYKLANDELGHSATLHSQVIMIIENYKKSNGDIPEAMRILYEMMHKKHTYDSAIAKGLLSLYK